MAGIAPATSASSGRIGESLRLRGRKKEMIVLSDGRNVFPEDVEPTLRADPPIRDCTVVGRPRQGGSGGAEVHAVIIPEAGGRWWATC